MVIEGVNIRHYRANGIEIDGGSGNRIIKNKINNTLNVGILISNSGRNLIWKNQITRCADGIMLVLDGASNNWIIDNTAKECFDDGFDAASSTLNSNAFISNKAIINRFAGFDVLGSNNLLLNNTAIDNRQGILINVGSNTVSIGMPEYLKPKQEYALGTCKKELAALEQALAKLEEVSSVSRRF